jgi:glycosyltransferase involved in cell wall biosynthesis
MADHGPFDVVHGFWADPAGALAVRMGRRFGIPSIVTCDSGEFESLHDISYGSQRTWRGRRAVGDALRATRVHVCTDFMARKAAARGVTAVVIPLTSIARDAEPTPRPLERTTPLLLIQVATLSRVKNQRLLIDVVATLGRTTDVHVNLVGEDTLRGELQRHAAARGISDRITFSGFVPRDRLPENLQRADFYVQTSRHEAAGVSVLEAAAHGVPVIGTRVGYIADWALDRAVAVDSPDAAALADAIVALHNDRAAAAAMAERARRWVLERNVSWVALQCEDLYSATLSR